MGVAPEYVLQLGVALKTACQAPVAWRLFVIYGICQDHFGNVT
jgi:hypothetical protein